MTAAVGAVGSLDIGRVASRTFGTIGRNPLVFGLLGLVFAGLPRFALQWEIVQAQKDLSNLLAYGGLSGLAVLIGTFLLQGALTYGAVADLNGARPSLAECLTNGLRAILPLIALSILMGVALVVGFLLLIVPGVLMALAWSVAVPSLVVERTGVFGAFSRSADLTRGHRGAILIIAIVFWVLSVIAGLVLGLVLAVVMGVSHVSGADSSSVAVLSGMVQGVISTVEGIIGAAGVATIYVELRAIKEGAGPRDLAAVFD